MTRGEAYRLMAREVLANDAREYMISQPYAVADRLLMAHQRDPNAVANERTAGLLYDAIGMLAGLERNGVVVGLSDGDPEAGRGAPVLGAVEVHTPARVGPDALAPQRLGGEGDPPPAVVP